MNDTERPDYCEVSDSCYRQPDRFTAWAEECEPWEDNYLWMCGPCYKAIKYGNQIPVGNLRVERSIDTDTNQ